ncbi:MULTISPECIES: hypothetical protein [Clostridium]|uniref:5-bromo-4-chloroindolyl phosphate hydrolysis protein n=1 Tax=Clostridium disporicum TaxID=84024 RepID=A0A174A0L9_9CLOT|nr:MULTISPECIES: hypothetical protein [Clostridium]MBX9184209.1 hypothetical protein [Clostridium sp. K04]MDU3520618.1 hypothetical protein [Clostridium saudiense]MDU7452874.1 hypothetical protein [Clostridium saudiense]CUN81370.1 Uncharacterised protein [Clostridium disporicum]SCJ73413.1 Uncharacterised protein [uncultured Clostridium sp.]
MKVKRISSLLGLNIAIVMLNIIIFSPGLFNIKIDFINIFQTSIGITIIIMSFIIFIIGNYKILIKEDNEIDISKLDDSEDYIEALKENSSKRVFSKDIDILLEQIERMDKKQEKIDDILLQKFTVNEMSYIKFKKTITEVRDVFYINIKSVINKINIFDEQEYEKIKKDIKNGKLNGKIEEQKKDMFDEYIFFVKDSIEDNEEILLKLDKFLFELSKFNSLEDGELENMSAIKDVDELINKIKFYK